MATPLEFIRSNRKWVIIVGVAVVLLSVLAAAWNVGMNTSTATDRLTVSKNSLGMMYGSGSAEIAASDSYAPPMAVQSGGARPSIVMPPVPGTPSAGPTAAEVDQKIIKTGNLSLVVAKAEDAAKHIGDLATGLKGFVQASSVSELADGTHSGNVTIRVPADQFDIALSQIKSLATVVKNENVTGQDVTEQYTDLQARLRNAQAQEQTYLEILKQARTVDDTLKVQEQLGIIRGEIESMQGQLKYLTNVTAYSTISVYIEEEPTVRAPTKDFRPLDLAKASVQTLINALQTLVAGLIQVIIVGGGILLPIALIVWIIYIVAKTLAKRRNRG